ncbi:metallophosphatase family protein [Undibacterium sp. Jales W-56]|uniref:metallophosphoesterase family protein n=1 Tax=Undibacterium sp. Jales W-56 TaxID=2897325 RepID=UPI0021D1F822|nr:metallophosphatase family protein [Undibacterium sp. Jales W-56]MCU6435242.1 metallophosphatase family protein [Undibacterium sp. Jales W-56]
MIRIAQFSDLHYSGKHLAEADRCFSHAIERAIALKVDAAVISGDSTDHALDMHAPAALRLASNIRRLAEHCPILMLQGTYSHEPPGTLALFRLLGGRYPVHVADRIGQVALSRDGNWTASDDWRFEQLPSNMRALFSCVPTVNKATVAAAVGAATAAVAVGEQLGVLLAGFAPANQAARESGIPTIGVSHGTVYGCMTEHGVPMAGFDHEFTTGTLFGAQAQAFMLGHIHRHQEWEANGRRIAYAGSIGRFHYGEDGEKGFLLWEVDATTARLALDTTPARRTIDICFEGKPDIDALQAAIKRQEVAGAFVRVRWSIGDEDRHEVDRDAIGRMLSAAAEVKLEGRIVPVVRSRAAGMSQAATIADKVSAWARAAEAKAEPLLACLECLHTFAPEVIASDILERRSEASVQNLPNMSGSASHAASCVAADAMQSPA